MPAATETTVVLRHTVTLARDGEVNRRAVDLLGGWVAEETLAIAVSGAPVRPESSQFVGALALAVTPSFDRALRQWHPKSVACPWHDPLNSIHVICTPDLGRGWWELN